MSGELEGVGRRRRIAWLGAMFAALAILLVGRLVWWQILPRPEIAELGIGGNELPNTIKAARGNILDATGNYLAASTVRYEVSVSPGLLDDEQKQELAPQLAAILGWPEEDMLRLLQEGNPNYEPLYALAGTTKVTLLPPEYGAALEALGSDALSLRSKFERVYPDDGLAAAVLGFVDYEAVGHYGLESYYSRELQGTEGRWYGVRDPWGEQILVSLSGYQAAQDGADLVLTLDRNIQHEAERILAAGIEAQKAASGSIVVLDPQTGGILAMAVYPSYKPGAYGEAESNENYVNTAVSAIYEPGSVFKPLTLAAALEAGTITPESSYDDRGEIIVGGQKIMNSDRQAHGTTTMTELLAYSRNVGAAYVATTLGPTRFYEIMRRFGFGEITGVDLALESPGIMRVPGNTYWHISDLGTNSYGQGISVTPLQVVAAYGALANDGLLMRPYIVAQMRNGDQIETRSPTPVRQVVRAEVARQVTEMMADAVDLGLPNAVVPGYRMAGKSGTAGIPDQEGYTDRAAIIASFAGFGPLPDPRFVILVKYDRPQEGYWGAEVAAPEFREMAQYLVDYYGIPPTR